MNIEDAKNIPQRKKLLLLTCARPETLAVERCFHPAGQPPRVADARQPYRYLGQHGDLHVFTVVTPSLGSQEAQATVHQAFIELDPANVIAVGIAFGIDAGKQQIGDVLIASAVQGYDIARMEPDGRVTYRDRPQQTSRMLCQFFLDRDHRGKPDACTAEWPRIITGTLLSGGKLIDNLSYRDSVVTMFSEVVIGGEMEAVGIAAAAQADASKREWIIVKAICDFADGQKNTRDKEAHQALAAWNAALVVKAVIDPEGMAGLVTPASPSSIAAPASTQTARTETQAKLDLSVVDEPPRTACQLQLGQAIEGYAALPSAQRSPFSSSWNSSLASLTDVLTELASRGAVKFLGDLQDAVNAAFHRPHAGGTAFADASVVKLVYGLTAVGLEQHARDVMQPTRDPGNEWVTVGAVDVAAGAVLAAFWLDAGLVIHRDVDRGGLRVGNLVDDTPQTEFGHLSAVDGIGAELAARLQIAMRSPFMPLPQAREQIRSQGLMSDRVITDLLDRYAKQHGARFMVGLGPARDHRGESLMVLVKQLQDRFGVQAFVHNPGSDDSRAMAGLQADLLHHFDNIVRAVQTLTPAAGAHQA